MTLILFIAIAFSIPLVLAWTIVLYFDLIDREIDRELR